MSFGFSVGDFVAVLQLANSIRKQFVDAPSQFSAISKEVKSLAIVLQDIDDILSARDLTSQQQTDLGAIVAHCDGVLKELNKIVIKFKALDLNTKSLDGKPRTVWNRFRWDQKDVDELRSLIVSNILLLNTFLGRVSSKAEFAIKDGIERLYERQDIQELRQEAQEQQQERKIILDWLTPVDYTTLQCDFITQRQTGTGQWLLDSTEYKSWLIADQQTLFCPGIPGAGKTILTAVAINDLTGRLQNDPDVGMAYIYCNFRRKDEQRAQDLLASLLKQLSEARSSFPDNVKSLYDKHKEKQSRPTLVEISRNLQSVARTYSRIIIVVDALDECQVEHSCRMTFLTELFSLQTKTRANLFATSRFISDITEKFKGSITIEIRAHDEDVRQYLDGRILRSGKKLLETHREEIKMGITKTVDGMFLLAQLHFESVSTRTTVKKMKDAFKKLPTRPKAYDYAYGEAMKRIAGQDAGSEELAKQVLLWITCSKRLLSTSELQHALAVEVGEAAIDEENLPQIEDIVSVCAGLVTVDKKSSIIRLLHYTTQEYFKRTQHDLFPNAESKIATTCITYLSFNKFDCGFCQTDEELEKRLQSNKLYDYASHNWGHHARKAFILVPEVINFLGRKAQAEASSQALLATKRYLSDSEYSQRFPKKMTGLHLAAYFGVEAVIKLLLKRGADVMAADTSGSTPLHWASSNGHNGVVQLLLDKGANVAAANTDGWTPLHHASSSSNIDVAKLLLDSGADLAAADINGWTALHQACSGGHIDIIKLLLDSGANVAAADTEGLMPLHFASSNGPIDVVKLLLDRGANIAAADTAGWTPLHHASSSGHMDVVLLLLDIGANLAAADTEGLMPLHLASSSGHIDVVQLLLDKGANIAAADTNGWTPLHLASSGGHMDVVKLLLNSGADLAAAETEGLMPLHLASSGGYFDVVKLLLDSGADLAAADSDGWTPLHLASSSGHIDVVQLLSDSGARFDS